MYKRQDYGSDLNNWSVGIRLDYGGNRFVMCGDAESGAEADILDNGIDISADVLKAGHHGSSTSTSEAFLDRVSPSVAVIQCGRDNSYGHPHNETLEKFKERGIQVYRNDQDGTVVAYCDGTDIYWGTEAAGTIKTPAAGSSGQAGSYGQTGDSGQASGFGHAGGYGSTEGGYGQADASRQTNAAAETGGGASAAETTYILNTNTKKFHLPTCGSAQKIHDENRETWEGSRDDLIQQGYSPCGQCKP